MTSKARASPELTSAIKELTADVERLDTAITAYRKLLDKGGKSTTYFEPRLEQAAWGLGEALRGQREYPDAAAAYESVQGFRNVDPDLRERATLAAGEVYDLMSRRDLAIQRYQQVISADSRSWRADLARKYLGSLLRFEVGEREREAVERFLSESAELGLVEAREVVWAAKKARAGA